jgi:hypothetical protein
VLRQWAIAGRLPTYDRLNTSNAYEGGAFAYLAKSGKLVPMVDKARSVVGTGEAQEPGADNTLRQTATGSGS